MHVYTCFVKVNNVAFKNNRRFFILFLYTTYVNSVNIIKIFRSISTKLHDTKNVK